MSDVTYDAPRTGTLDADGERRALLGREAALRMVGVLAMLLGVALILFGFGLIGLARDAGYLPTRGIALIAVPLFLGASGLVLGWGLVEL